MSWPLRCKGGRFVNPTDLPEGLPSAVCDAERELLARVAEWPHFCDWRDLTYPVLARLAAEQGMDFATALLYDRLRRSTDHGPFIRRIDELLAGPPSFDRNLDLLLAVAPGAYYRELPKAGGDGSKLREQAAAFGCRTTVIPTHSMGTVAENGRILFDWLSEGRAERVVLASISKGAADIKAALTLPGAAEAFRPVVAWLNLSGLPNGTPIANWLFERRLATLFYRAAFWWKGLDIEVLRQCAWGPGAVLDFPWRLPPHIRLISVAGFPLRRYMSSGALATYQRRLAPRGPNDGLLLLADVCSLPGLVYPVWGADHNLRPAWDIRRLVAALAFYLAETLQLWEGPKEDIDPALAHSQASPP
jgi:hypothetical protein